jgi:hypothetical protein
VREVERPVTLPGRQLRESIVLGPRFFRPFRALALAIIAASVGLSFAAPTVLGHEERQVAGYDIEVGLIDEPVFVGDRSGLEMFVHKGDQPVEGLDKTLKATVSYGDRSIELALSPRESDAGAYESVFIPTAAGAYTFHITGTIEAATIDETFTSSPSGFGEVEDVASGQFPAQLPSVVDLASQADKGAEAAARLPIAIGLGAAGLLLGIVALGIALASRRQRPDDEVGSPAIAEPAVPGSVARTPRRRRS